MYLLPNTPCPIHVDCYTYTKDDGTKTCEAWEEMTPTERKQDDEGIAQLDRILAAATSFPDPFSRTI